MELICDLKPKPTSLSDIDDLDAANQAVFSAMTDLGFAGYIIIGFHQQIFNGISPA